MTALDAAMTTPHSSADARTAAHAHPHTHTRSRAFSHVLEKVVAAHAALHHQLALLRIQILRDGGQLDLREVRSLRGMMWEPKMSQKALRLVDLGFDLPQGAVAADERRTNLQ